MRREPPRRCGSLGRLWIEARSTSWLWYLSAGSLLTACSAWTYLSGHFRYGEGHADRPIVEFVLLYFLAWGAFIMGFALLKKSQGRGPLKLILIAALLARVLLLPSHLIQENDVYRYVLDGQVVRHGVNPYRYSPLVVADLASEPLATELKTAEAKQVLSRVGYPEIPTVYPPAAQGIFAVGAWLGGWSWMGRRVLFLGVDLALLILILCLLRSLNLAGGWVLLYAWNPLVLKEVANSVHLDVWVAFFLILTVMALLKQDRVGGRTPSICAGIALGCAILTKLYPILLLPGCCLFFTRRRRFFPDTAIFTLAVAATLTIGFLPFWSVGWDRLAAGLTIYVKQWTMNQGAFSVLSWGLPDHQARLATALAIGLISVLIPWWRNSGDVESLLRDFQWVLLLWFLLIPTPFPWYALVLVSLLPLRPLDSGPSVATLVLSGAFGLYYLGFLYEYGQYPSVWWVLTRGLEHLPVWLSAAISGPLYLERRINDENAGGFRIHESENRDHHSCLRRGAGRRTDC